MGNLCLSSGWYFWREIKLSSTVLYDVKLSEIPFSDPLRLHQLWTLAEVKNQLKWVGWEGGKYDFTDSLERLKIQILCWKTFLSKITLYFVASLCFLQVPRYLFWYLSRKPWFRKPVMYYGEWLKWVIFLGLCLFWCKMGFIFGGNNAAAVVWNTVNGVVKVH